MFYYIFLFQSGTLYDRRIMKSQFIEIYQSCIHQPFPVSIYIKFKRPYNLHSLLRTLSNKMWQEFSYKVWLGLLCNSVVVRCLNNDEGAV